MCITTCLSSVQLCVCVTRHRGRNVKWGEEKKQGFKYASEKLLYLRLCSRADVNVVFRGNGRRKAEREQEEAAPAEEVFSSQATRCGREMEKQTGGGGGEQRKLQQLQEREAETRVRDRGRKERKGMESMSATSQRPPAVSPIRIPTCHIRLGGEK